MIVRYRILKYEAETQEAMDHQIGNSIAEGVYKCNPSLKFYVKNHEEDAVIDSYNSITDDEFWNKLPERPDGCITNNQLRQKYLNERPS